MKTDETMLSNKTTTRIIVLLTDVIRLVPEKTLKQHPELTLDYNQLILAHRHALAKIYGVGKHTYSYNIRQCLDYQGRAYENEH